jgi:uncharacterized coiled-coil protein SlyX
VLKKTIIAIVCIILFGAACFFTGYFSRQSGFDELESRAEELGSLLESQETTITALKTGLRESNGTIDTLRTEIRNITEQNNSLTEKLGNIGNGLYGDIGAIQRIAEGIDKYLAEDKD